MDDLGVLAQRFSKTAGALKLAFKADELPDDVRAALETIMSTLSGILDDDEGAEPEETPSSPAKLTDRNKPGKQRVRAVGLSEPQRKAACAIFGEPWCEGKGDKAMKDPASLAGHYYRLGSRRLNGFAEYLFDRWRR